MLISDIWSAFQQGKSLANSATWKKRAVAVNALSAFVGSALAIAAAFGYHIDIDNDTIQAIAGGVAAVVCLFNGGVHATTTDKIGLPTQSE